MKQTFLSYVVSIYILITLQYLLSNRSYLGGLVVTDDYGCVPLCGAFRPINFDPETDQDAGRSQQDSLAVLHLGPSPNGVSPGHRALSQLPVLLQRRAKPNRDWSFVRETWLRESGLYLPLALPKSCPRFRKETRRKEKSAQFDKR